MDTVFEAFAAAHARAPGNAFFCVPPAAGRGYDPEGTEYSYAQAMANIRYLRARYREAGYGYGHRVALLLENRPAFVLHYLALNSLGVAIVPINPDYRFDEIHYLLEHSESDLVVSIATCLPFLTGIAKKTTKQCRVLNADRLPARFPLAKTQRKNGTPCQESECSILYTSGTTGRPKGCILSNGYYLNAGRWYLELGGAATLQDGSERIYNPLPLFHINNQAIMLTAVMLGGHCAIVPDRFSPQRWWPDVVGCRASIVHYLGVVPPLLLNRAPDPLERQHHVRFGIGAGVEPLLHRQFEDRFAFPLIEVWGMTETGRIFADHIPPRQIDTRAFGRAPMKDLLARVVDEHENECPRGQAGELVVRAAGDNPRRGFFSGYLKNDEATEKAWQGGWFHTGDIVMQMADDMLIFVDRKKNIIRRAGENIAAAEVEEVLQAHPWVAQVAVIAVPDEVREEEVMACVVLMPEVEASSVCADVLLAACNDKLAYFKAPGWLLFMATLPTTGTQKIQKSQIFPAGADPRQAKGVFDLRQRKRRS